LQQPSPSSPYTAIAIFAIVYFLVIFGRKKFNIPLWISMVIGAALIVGFQIISIESALKSINVDVIGFLFGMFSIVSALDISGVLKKIALKMLSMTNGNHVLILMVFVVGMGLLSAFLVNDTIAVLGIPFIIHITRETKIRPQVFLIALSFGITIGSAMTPIGNPQNLLIAIQSGIPTPFITFIKILGIPTIINLFVTFLILKIYFKKDLSLSPSIVKIFQNSNNSSKQYNLQIKDNMENIKINLPLAKVSTFILIITVLGFILSEIIQFVFHFTASFSLSVIALLGAAALYTFSKERRAILAKVDFTILIFFASMFIFSSGLWSSGFISQATSYFPAPDRNNTLQSNAAISLISISLSQVLSNVPFVALYDQVMINNGFGHELNSINNNNNNNNINHTNQWMMLAAASTIAGNLTILAAASNIIIIESAEPKGLAAFSFIEFLKIGAIVTTANILIYYIFIVFVFT
jgi:Na+/H+ antiporter NhaD/arsenite permease-like protein